MARWGHWLGTGNRVGRKPDFLPFKKALFYAHSLKITGEMEWRAWCKSNARPSNVPSHPDAIYKHEGWQGYGHWLGTGTVAPKDHQFLPFKKALLHARSLKLQSKAEWRVLCKSGARPANILCNSDRTYTHEGWQGFGHWLDTGKFRVAESPNGIIFLPFEKALLCARSLKLKGKAEWEAWSNGGARPANMPPTPDRTYKQEGWQGMGHWLGI